MHKDNFTIGTTIDKLNRQFLDTVQGFVNEYTAQLNANNIETDYSVGYPFMDIAYAGIYNPEAITGRGLPRDKYDRVLLENVEAAHEYYKKRCEQENVFPITCFFALEQYYDTYTFSLEY